MLMMTAMLAATARAQLNYAVDTALLRSDSCHARFVPYWSVKAKYPQSSRRLAALADSTIPAAARAGLPDGFINLQFVVSCQGITSGYRLSQTDAHYQPVAYPEAVVNALYFFVKALNRWKPAVYQQEPVYYKAYLAFKIRNGHVVEVSP